MICPMSPQPPPPPPPWTHHCFQWLYKTPIEYDVYPSLGHIGWSVDLTSFTERCYLWSSKVNCLLCAMVHDGAIISDSQYVHDRISTPCETYGINFKRLFFSFSFFFARCIRRSPMSYGIEIRFKGTILLLFTIGNIILHYISFWGLILPKTVYGKYNQVSIDRFGTISIIISCTITHNIKIKKLL